MTGLYRHKISHWHKIGMKDTRFINIEGYHPTYLYKDGNVIWSSWFDARYMELDRYCGMIKW